MVNNSFVLVTSLLVPYRRCHEYVTLTFTTHSQESTPKMSGHKLRSCANWQSALAIRRKANGRTTRAQFIFSFLFFF